MLVDATDSNTARIVPGYVNQVTTAFNRRLRSRAAPCWSARKCGFGINPGRDSPKFYGPGIFVLGISMFPPCWPPSPWRKRENRRPFCRSTFRAFPAHEFLLGKILGVHGGSRLRMRFWLMTCLFTVFRPALRGRSHALHRRHAFSTRFASPASEHSIGAAIPNQAAAMQTVALGGFLLVFLLSGLIFPVENIPARIALAFQYRLGPLLHRNRARRSAARRRMAGHVVHGLHDAASSARSSTCWRGATCAACR